MGVSGQAQGSWKEGWEGEGLCHVPLQVGRNLQTSPAAAETKALRLHASLFLLQDAFLLGASGLLIILIKGGQWIQETVTCMRALGTDLSLCCL